MFFQWVVRSAGKTQG